MTITIRTITDEEILTFRTTLIAAFGEDAEDADPGGTERVRKLLSTSRMWGAFDGASMVGTAGTFVHELAVPGGGTLPIAGLTMVSVRPTHRRRGILRELIGAHLAEAATRDVPASALWASEASIYGRFGYGLAAMHDELEIRDAGHVRFADRWRDDADAVEAIDEATARTVLPAIYARATAGRPGALRRSDLWWHERRFLETPFARRGASRRRHVIARRGGEDVGYVQYRQRSGFTDGLPSGKLEIIELVAIDARAEASLWRFAMSVDLFPTVTWWCAPIDCPLPWMLADWRRVRRTRLDNVWLRIEDVPRCLALRSYPRDGALRLAVDDTTWQLEVQGGVAQCTPSSAPAELALDRASLGALFLGGTSASALARAELARGDAGAIAVADSLFASAVAPWCPEVF